MDPLNLLNPGKAQRPPLLLWRPTFKMGMDVLAGVCRAGKYDRICDWRSGRYDCALRRPGS